MGLTDFSNWLSFNIFFIPDTMIGGIKKYQEWYFKFLKDTLKPFLSIHDEIIKNVYFGDYFYHIPVDEIIIDEFRISKWVERLDKLKDERKIPQDYINQIKENVRFIRLRFFIKINQRELIINNFIKKLESIPYILGFQLVKYDVITDLGKRYSSRKNKWKDSLDQLKRLENFIIYWNGICRYILSIITDDYHLDFENVDIMGILHLGFHSLGSNLPIDKCENCGSVSYLMSNYQPSCYFRCNCGLTRKTLSHL